MEGKENKKTCSFYASEYHFDMMAISYIKEELRKDKKIVVLTEKDLEKSVKTVVGKMNLNDDEIRNIMEINWKEENFNKFKEIKENKERKKDILVLIKGNQNYIKNVNDNIQKFVNNYSDIKIVDFYDIEEIKNNRNNICNNYDKMINMLGEVNIKK